MFKVMAKVSALKSQTTPAARRWLKSELQRVGRELREREAALGHTAHVVAIDRALDVLDVLDVG